LEQRPIISLVRIITSASSMFPCSNSPALVAHLLSLNHVKKDPRYHQPIKTLNTIKNIYRNLHVNPKKVSTT